MIALGFLLAAVGIDVVNGQERFTFGFINLSGGIDLLAVVIGLFGVAEILSNVEEFTKNTVLPPGSAGSGRPGRLARVMEADPAG